MAEYILDTTDGIYNARMTGELVRCGDCIHFDRCPMRKGDGSGYCWQAKRREERNGHHMGDSGAICGHESRATDKYSRDAETRR